MGGHREDGVRACVCVCVPSIVTLRQLRPHPGTVRGFWWWGFTSSRAEGSCLLLRREWTRWGGDGDV